MTTKHLLARPLRTQIELDSVAVSRSDDVVPRVLLGRTVTSPGKELWMHASVRRYQAVDVEVLLERVQEEFVERVKTVEGFAGYYVIDGGDGTVTSITVAETGEAVEASNVLAKQWVVERAAHLVESAPELTTGEVRVRAER